MKIGFIGVGHMGGAILKGYIPIAKEQGNKIYVSDLDEAKLKELEKKYGIMPIESANELVKEVDIVIIGVRPRDCGNILGLIKKDLKENSILVSMAAGVTIRFIRECIGDSGKVIRIMPNIPAEVNEGVTSISRETGIENMIFEKICDIFTGIGAVHEVPEEQIHNVIGVSGSSPAYTFMYIDALAKSAEKRGMPREQAVAFAGQAVLGAAKLVLETGISPETLKNQVCVDGGTTIEACKVLDKEGFEELIDRAYEGAYARSIEMSKE